MCHASAQASLLPAPALCGQAHWLTTGGWASAGRRQPWQPAPRVVARRPVTGWRVAARAAGLALGSVAAAAVVWLMLAGPGFMAHDAHPARVARLAAR